VTVLPVNVPPTPILPLPDHTLDERGAPVQVHLSPYLCDVDGAALTDRAPANETRGIAPAVAGETVIADARSREGPRRGEVR